MGAHGGRGGVSNSENRDDARVEAILAAGRRQEKYLRAVAADPQKSGPVTRQLSAPTRPWASRYVPPSSLAWRLARELTWGSLEALHNAIAAEGGTVGLQILDSIELHLVAPPRQIGRTFLPLLQACSPEEVSPEHNAIDYLARWLAATRNKLFQQELAPLYRSLSALLIVEDYLWQFAAASGGPSPRMPYALRFQALQRLWSSDVSSPRQPVPTLCLRCGDAWVPLRAIAAPPRCRGCAKEPAHARQWPPHAVAPDNRSAWWLSCQAAECSDVFRGPRQARYCPAHRLSNITPGRRSRRRVRR